MPCLTGKPGVLVRWTVRLSVVALVGSLGVAVAPAQSSAPMAAPPAGPLAGTPGPGGSVEEYRLVASLKQQGTSAAVPGSLLRLAAELDLPAPALRAYRFAEAVLDRADPSCRLHWSLLAAIGQVESDHGRYGDATVSPDGTTSPHILGPPLDGTADVAAIADTDQGSLDGDTTWDRAVGPMQFIPSTWALVGADADGDGARDPHDLDDAALAAGAYLCSGAEDLGTTTGQRSAVYRYNPSDAYVDLVLRLAAAYANSDAAALTVPPAEGTATPLDLPSLRRPVQAPAHPAGPPRTGVDDLPQTLRQAVTAHSPTQAGTAPTSDAARTGPATGASSPARGGTSTGGDTGNDRTGTGGGTTGSGSPTTRTDTRRGDDSTGGSTNDTSGGGSTGGGGSTDGGGATGGGGTGGGGTSDGGGSTDGSSGGPSSDGSGSTDGGTSDGTTDDDGSSDAPADDGGDSTDEQPTTEATGVLDRADDGTWTVGDTVVDFGDADYLEAQALHDFDGTDGVESNLDELDTLIDDEVSVQLSDGNVVQELDDLTYR